MLLKSLPRIKNVTQSLPNPSEEGQRCRDKQRRNPKKYRSEKSGDVEETSMTWNILQVLLIYSPFMSIINTFQTCSK